MYLKITAVGNVGKDPESRFTPSGQQVTSFSMAINRQYKTKEETVKETTWLRVTSWGNQAAVVHEYVKKGMLVLVEGVLNPDKETGGPRIYKKGDGSPGAMFEVTAQTVKFLSRVESNDQEGRDEGSRPLVSEEEDFPF